MPFQINHFSNFMFTAVPVFVFIGFILVFGLIIINAIKGISQWNHNNSQPVLSVPAVVVSKRTDVSSSMHNDANDIGHHHHTYTTYFASFEVESGDRIEFQVKGQDYGILVEGDSGKLTFQGTRYLGFERNTI